MLFKEKVLDGHNKDALELWQTFMTTKFYEGLHYVLTDQDLEDVYFIEFINQIFLFKITNYHYYFIISKKENAPSNTTSVLIDCDIITDYFEHKFCSPDVGPVKAELEFFESNILELFTDCLFFDAQNYSLLMQFFNQFNTIKTNQSFFEDLIEKFVNASDFELVCTTAKDLFYYGITMQQATFSTQDCEKVIKNMPQSLIKLDLISQITNSLKSPYCNTLSGIRYKVRYVNTIFI